MTEPCTRKTFLGGAACQFEARYDLSPVDMSAFKSISVGPGSVDAFIDGNRSKTYVRDVCVKCGRTIERLALNPRGDGGGQ